MKLDELKTWLKTDDPDTIKTLFKKADIVRKQHVGDQVHFRGLIEFSNICRRSCGYCGIRAKNHDVTRYRLTSQSIVECSLKAEELGFGTVTLQSGEDPALNIQTLCKTIAQIKKQTSLAVTLSIGERSYQELKMLKEAGADRYLLRFETSNSDLYKTIHPSIPDQINHNRYEVLEWLEKLGYEVGSGIMVGIPGETWDDLAQDILMFKKLNLDMIGLGPYIPHPGTPLGQWAETHKTPAEDQTPNTPMMTLKVLALTRLICPDTNLPSTTALETINPQDGYEDGLACGANVIMPNLTPVKYRSLYDIYPSKAGQTRKAEVLIQRLEKNLRGLGRCAGKGPGISRNFLHRMRNKERDII